MRTAPLLALAAALAVPTSPMAQVSLGLRAGYSIPFGDAANVGGFGSFKEKDLFSAVAPLQVEASWRFTPALSAGLYFAYGIGFQGTQLHDLVCANASSCSAIRDLHLGARAAWTFGTVAGVAPWIGLGGGLEAAHFEATRATFPTGLPPPSPPIISGDLDGTFRGWEVMLEGGFDWWATPAVGFGPFVQLQIGQYRVQDVSFVFPVPGNGGIPEPKPHEFLTVGLRCRLDL
jgi:hypothetical protein